MRCIVIVYVEMVDGIKNHLEDLENHVKVAESPPTLDTGSTKTAGEF